MMGRRTLIKKKAKDKRIMKKIYRHGEKNKITAINRIISVIKININIPVKIQPYFQEVYKI